jgi:hypothetical protein
VKSEPYDGKSKSRLLIIGMVIARYPVSGAVFNDLTIGTAIPMTRSQTMMRFLSDLEVT